MGKSGAWIEVDLQRAERNFRALRSFIPREVKLCAVVKNDGYGMGLERIGPLYDRLGAQWFAVASPGEALRLGQALPGRDILILGGAEAEELEQVLREGISMTVYDGEQAAAISRMAAELGRPAKIQLKVDTGLRRLGLEPNAKGLAEAMGILRLPGLLLTGIYTHFANAGDSAFTRLQIERFRYFLDELASAGIKAPLVHASSSRALADYPEYHFDMVRPGLLLTGFHYFGRQLPEGLELTPCVGVKSRLLQVKRIAPGESVGYGGSFTAKEETLVGTLPLGYGQGLSRAFANRIYCLCQGQPCRQIGNMNHCMVELNKAPEARAGEEVTLFGLGDDGALTIADGAKIRDSNIEETLAAFIGKLPVSYC